ncbi:V-type ATP synthase subunit I [Faecalicatena contorta]|uniref:V-type ATP synthase subunit I n=1 Tax=Faecalicatena contorta TaxID=39482 RepID=UPI001F31E790|nr:V-type ATPase 116kDa subunit family protein [Faecalicatena contorta]MCF2682077.1 ATPase [Faecalicatena contorta]
MIVKMKFLSISGPKNDIDRVCDQYLSKYEMQLENAIAELKTTDNLQPFVEVNPYKEPLAKAEQFASLLGDDNCKIDTSMSKEEMLDMIRDINHDYVNMLEKKELLKKQADDLRERLSVLEPFRTLELDMHKSLRYKYMRVRFGRIGVDYYKRLEKYLFDDLNAIFVQSTRNENYVYGCYFVANVDASKVDTVFNSLHFEKIAIPSAYIGTPEQACEELQNKINDVQEEIKELDQTIEKLMQSHAPQLVGAQKKLESMSNNFDVRKLAARIDQGEDEEKEEYYILCGWMGEDDVKKFMKEIEHDNRVFVVVEEDREKFFGEPPTKLKNPKFFKPFEMFIRMYGLPASDEMDPTMFVALTYTFIFGAMFGDVGQGLCLFVFGGLLYLIKKINLAGIISIAGLFSTFFGFMYGSVFGFENILEARWLRPVEAMTNLPFIGQLNTVFVVAIAFGMALNILVMIFNVINAMKKHDLENLFFSHNGLAGLVFYGFLVLTIVLYMTGHKVPGNALMAVFLGVPILFFVFKEPLGNLVEKRHRKMKEGKVMFFVQAFFELFETILSYFSNTISYVRIGAFAVSHAAMMEVVLMLSGATEGSTNWIVFVLGNILVSGLEGLVVGIQVLRLEYYEMFSRFYRGTGREFKPFNRKEQ